MRYIRHAISHKIQCYVQIHSIFNRCFLEISTSGAHKDEERPCSHLGVSFLFHDDSRRPFWVRTDKGKEFLNKHFQDMLREESIQFQICRNPDVKCAVVERVHRTEVGYPNFLHSLIVIGK